MIDKIKMLFSTPAAQQAAPVDAAERLRVATCVLLLEVARCDEEFSDEEEGQILQTLRERFSITEEEAQALVEDSTRSREESVDLWRYTHQINKACDTEEKIRIVEEVWRVIYADTVLDGHEDHLVHRIAKLFNLTHGHLIEAKLWVLDEIRGT